MPKCPVCDCEDFDLQDGLYYCTECCTQSQVIREEGLEADYVEGVRNVRTIGTRQKRKKRHKDEPGYQWHMVEAFNIILHEQTMALVALGAGPKFEEHVLHLWSRYLKQCEQAFVRSNSTWSPKFCSRPYPRDLQVTCGFVVKCRRLVQRGPDKVALVGLHEKINRQPTKQDTPEDLEKAKHKRRKRKKKINLGDADPPPVADEESAGQKVETIRPKKFWNCLLSKRKRFSVVALEIFKRSRSRAKTMVSNSQICVDRIDLLTTTSLLCLALRINCPNILFSDVSRWIREGHIPYMQAHKLLPTEWKIFSNEKVYFQPKHEPSVAALQLGMIRLSRFLRLQKKYPVDVQYVAARYLADMNLPQQKKIGENLDSIKRNFSRLTREGRAREPDPTEPANSFPIRTILKKCLSRMNLEVEDYTKRKIHPVRSQLYWFCHQFSNNGDVRFPDSFLVPFYVLQEVLDWKLKDVILDLKNLEQLVFGMKKSTQSGLST